MILNCLLKLAPLAAQWFGPVTVDRTLTTKGNPFDSTANDVRAIFIQPGHRHERLAYFGNGKWHATLSAPEGGRYQVQFYVNGKLTPGETTFITLRPSSDGDFVRRDGHRFKLESGKPYVPFGHNLAWQYGGAASYGVQVADMAKAGLNWTRIWANRWDTKSPFLPQDPAKKLELGWMNEPAFERWDSIISDCEKNNIKFQFVLFHHGLFSTTTDPNWGEHPWNVANGGFLADPTDYFVNVTAKRLTKNWLRYAVARWGHSTSVMAWELFNEVQWVDAARKHPERLKDVIAWHREMGEYVRSIDPYHHLVTSSSSEEINPEVFDTMDYLQPHNYPPNIFPGILANPVPKDRPTFVGEFGVHFETVTEPVAKRALRDGFWAGLLSGEAGPAQYWYWDEAYKYHLYDEYLRESKVLARSGFAQNADVKPTSIKVMGGLPSDLTVTPGIGWGTTTKFVHSLPADASNGSLPQVSSFIQSVGSHNRNLMSEPIRLRFNASEDGVARIVIGEISKAGGAIELKLNGQMAATQAWKAATADHTVVQEFLIPYSKGQNELSIDNVGEDWVKLKAVTLPKLGDGVISTCLASNSYSLMRLQWVGGIGTQPKTVTIPALKDGEYEMRQFDVQTGVEKDSVIEVSNGQIADYHPASTDEGVALFWRNARKVE